MTFKIGIHYPRRTAPVTPYLEAFEQGVRRHNVAVESVVFPEHSVCDLAVCWNHRNHRLFADQTARGMDYLCLERGYMGSRSQWTAWCFNGLNGYADWTHCNDSPADRFFKHHISNIKPYKTGGNEILVIGQVSGDASLHGINFKSWAEQVISELKTVSENRPIVFRPHPICIEREIDMIPANCDQVSAHPCCYGEDIRGATLAQDLDRAKVCVTFNSNAGVEAVLAGVPTVSFDKGSMVYDITSHDPIITPPTPDRMQWAYNMAYKQWTLEEMSNGTAWDHARRRYGY